VEVTLAIGIVAFAFVALFALLPVGLTTFRQAMDTSVTAQIFQRIVSEAQETDFDSLLVSAEEKGKGRNNQYYVFPLRYFDDQGNEVKVNNPANPTAAELQRVIYTARVRGADPGPADPSKSSGAPTSYSVSLPSVGGSGTARFRPRDITFLTIQIANNPGRKNLTAMLDANNTYLWLPQIATNPNDRVPVQTYSAIVARNGYTPKDEIKRL
jgi:uncharacterized protein (TIGR02598 family)